MRTLLLNPVTILRRLHSDQRGTALTEFAITLPIYLAFVTGIIGLYNAQRGVIEAEKIAGAGLWEDAISIQHSYQIDHMMPLAGSVSVQQYYSHVNDSFLGFSFDGGLSFDSMLAPAVDYAAAMGGMYVDSGGKVLPFHTLQMADTSFDGQDFSPQLRLSPNLMDSSSFSHTLMNDLVGLPSGGWGSFGAVVGNLLTMTGTRPALAAGIRYGVASGTAEYMAFNGTGYEPVPIGYVASAPPMPEERVAAVLFSYMEVSSDSSFQNMIHFGLSNIGGSASGITDPDVEAATEAANECGEHAEAYGDCVQNAMDNYPGIPGCDERCYIDMLCDDIMPDHCDTSGDGGASDIGDCLEGSSWGSVGTPGDPTSGC